EQGQLGDGRGQASLTPTRVVGIDDAVDISAGRRTACAVRADGSIVCWGDLQRVAGVELGVELSPKLVSGFQGAVEVAVCAGRYSDDALCARHQDGTISCAATCSE